MKGDEDLITNGIETDKEVSPKSVKFFLIYFGLYLSVWVVFFIASRVYNPNYFKDSLEVSYVIIGFLFSIALAAVLGVIPAIILENSKKKGYVYFCVLGLLIINILAFFFIGTDLKPLCWIPIFYDLPFFLIKDAISPDTTLTESSSALNLLYLAVFPTVYYLLLVWISLRASRGCWRKA
jgi:hypothetical protein